MYASIQLALANPGPGVMDKLHASKFTELLGQERIFLTVGEAVMTCCPNSKEDSSSSF